MRGSSDTGEGSTTSTAVVEGIEVSTDHWIGGRRVPSPATFTDVSPIDEQPKKRYPVLYVLDGQALWQHSTDPYGTWGMDGTLSFLCRIHVTACGPVVIRDRRWIQGAVDD